MNIRKFSNMHISNFNGSFSSVYVLVIVQSFDNIVVYQISQNKVYTAKTNKFEKFLLKPSEVIFNVRFIVMQGCKIKFVINLHNE